jgi:hypothetical protein
MATSMSRSSPVPLAVARPRPDDDDLVPRVDELPGLNAKVLVDLEHLSQRLSDLRATTRAWLDGLRKLVPLEILRHQIRADTEIASPPAFMHSANDLHVLLRHRLGSISRMEASG